MQEFLLQLRLAAINPVRYKDENCFTDSEIKILTSVKKEQFLELWFYPSHGTLNAKSQDLCVVLPQVEKILDVDFLVRPLIGVENHQFRTRLMDANISPAGLLLRVHVCYGGHRLSIFSSDSQPCRQFLIDLIKFVFQFGIFLLSISISDNKI